MSRIHLLPVLGRLRLDKINGEVVARLGHSTINRKYL
jgi:hypothetical protein